MAVERKTVADQRDDVSRFVVHLTRDNRSDAAEGGATARDNFKAIVRTRCVRGFRPYCLHNLRMHAVPDEKKEEFNVACFTETPLHQIHLLTQDVQGRLFRFESYGVVFTRGFLVSNGAQPTFYVNSYGRNGYVRDAVDEIMNAAIEDGFEGRMWRILPFINAMHEKCDFTWEREWRVKKELRFNLKDLVCVILPENQDDDLKQNYRRMGLSYISPGWTYERIVDELASQQRATRKLAPSGSRLTIKKEPSNR